MATVTADTWEQVLILLRQEIGDQRFNLWFRNTTLVTADDGLLQVGVPNLFIKGWLEENFSETVGRCAGKACGWAGTVHFTVAGDLFRKMRSAQLSDGVADIEATTPDDGPGAALVEMSRAPTLDDLVVGPSNQLAHAAAMEVCFQTQPAFTRLFVHGGVGLGKTHILRGIALRLMEHGASDGEVEYVTAERWTNQYVYALRSNQFDAFRQKFRTVKTLLIDDVHFLKNKLGIQEEFLHTFDALDASSKRIVIASDSHPRDLQEVTKNLVTRFMSGMIAKLDKPDFQTRVRILAKKTEGASHAFPFEVIEYVADQVTSNVRELEGAVTTILAYAGLAGKPIDLPLVREALNEIGSAIGPVVTLKQIAEEVGAALGLTRAEVQSKRRTRAVSGARHMCVHLARELTQKSCRDIGAYFGGVKHSSVISACRSIEKRLGEDQELACIMAKVRGRLER